MKNVVDKIITVLSGISTKRNQIQQTLQTVLMTNQQYQAVNTLCDQISAKYFMVKDPLSDIGYLFKCRIGDLIYEGSQLDIQEDIIVWDKVAPNDGTQVWITIIDDYQGPGGCSYAYGIQQNQRIVLALNGYVLKNLSIYNKGQLTIQNNSDVEYEGWIKNGYYVINEGTLHIAGGILDAFIDGIDNNGSLFHLDGIIKNTIIKNNNVMVVQSSLDTLEIICSNNSKLDISNGNINGCKIILNKGSQLNYVGGSYKNSAFTIESNLRIFMYVDYQQNFTNFESCIFRVKQTGNLIIEYHGGRLQNTDSIIYLYGNRKYNYRQIVVKAPDMDEAEFQQIYSQGWCNVAAVYCCQGATLENYNGDIYYQ